MEESCLMRKELLITLRSVAHSFARPFGSGWVWVNRNNSIYEVKIKPGGTNCTAHSGREPRTTEDCRIFVQVVREL